MNDSQLLISRQSLLHNVQILRRALAPTTKVCAMVKADAYGHGANLVVDTLTNFVLEGTEAPAVDMLAVATIDEAADLSLNSHRHSLPLLILRPVENVFVGRNRDALELAIRNNWALTVITPSAAEDVARVAMSCGKRAKVHVMIDTGLVRCGAPVDGIAALLKKLESLSALQLVGLATHFANADVPGNPFTEDQLERFLAATDEFAARRAGRIVRHAANSGAIFFHPDSHLDMVRPGISLYGIDPTGRPNLNRALRPVMKWVAPLVAVHEVSPGTTAGYGQTWTADRHTRVGLVPVGYADGYPRAASNAARMIVHDMACPVVGRVSMDFTLIDLGLHATANTGDEVTIIASDPLSPASVYELARHSSTIPYEIFTRIGRRARRVAVDPVDSPVPAEAAD